MEIMVKVAYVSAIVTEHLYLRSVHKIENPEDLVREQSKREVNIGCPKLK